MEWRDYQRKAVESVLAAFAQHRSVLLISPTGSGKSVLIAELTRRLERKTIVGVHRREIVMQLAEKMRAVGLRTGVVLAGQHQDHEAPVLVGSVQSFARRASFAADFVVCDEAHHSASAQHAAFLSRYPKALVLGCTATGSRLDGRGLRDYFDTLIEAATPAELVAQGYLVAPKVFAPSTPDLTNVGMKRGDYEQTALQTAVNTSALVGDIVEHFQQHGIGPTLGFATGIAHSKALTAAFQEAGIQAEHLDGSTDHDVRLQSVARLRSGETRCLWNASLWTEGVDIPEVSTVIVARPTASLSLHLQIVGRVMRPLPGKTAVLLDHAGNTLRHGFVTDSRVWTLDGTPPTTKLTSPKAVRCNQCFAMNLPGSESCWQCGAVFPKPETPLPDVEDGTLVELRPPAPILGGPRVATWDYKKIWWEKHGTRDNAWKRFEERFAHKPCVYHGKLLHPTDPADKPARDALWYSMAKSMGSDRATATLKSRLR